MALLQPPSTAQNGCYTARQDRLMWASLICSPGVDRLGSMAVSAGVGLTVSVSDGGAWVYGDVVQDQGYYYVYNDAPVTVTIQTADPVDDRIDLIVVTVHDSEYTGTVDEGAITAVTGAPSPGPVAPATPDNSIILAEVYVPAGATSGLTVDTSTRQRARVCSDMTGTTAPDSGAIELNPSVARDISAIPGASWYGARFVGNMAQIQFQFYMNTSVTAGASGNITDMQIGTLDLTYKPSETVFGFVGPSAAAPWYGGLSTAGVIGLYAATYPNATISSGEAIRVNLTYPRSDL